MLAVSWCGAMVIARYSLAILTPGCGLAMFNGGSVGAATIAPSLIEQIPKNRGFRYGLGRWQCSECVPLKSNKGSAALS